ncbi:MAG: hypothetical protein J6J12_05670 [Oscillospiraceae bacterium]|nr:hypothetical protein [Oscillospiraceae bacterium]
MEYLLALLPAAALLLALKNALYKRKLGKQREFARRLETVLLPRETVKTILPQKKGNCVLTSKRVLFETKSGFTAVNIKDIKRTQGLSAEGKKTTSVPKMVSLTLKANEEYTVINTGEEFTDLAKQLTAKVKKQNEKKKIKKESK